MSGTTHDELIQMAIRFVENIRRREETVAIGERVFKEAVEELKKKEEELKKKEEKLKKREEELKKRAGDLARREWGLDHRELQFEQREEELAEREEELAEREQQLARREQQLARRASDLDQREQQLAEREQELDQREEAQEEEAAGRPSRKQQRWGITGIIASTNKNSYNKLRDLCDAAVRAFPEGSEERKNLEGFLRSQWESVASIERKLVAFARKYFEPAADPSHMDLLRGEEPSEQLLAIRKLLNGIREIPQQ